MPGSESCMEKASFSTLCHSEQRTSGILRYGQMSRRSREFCSRGSWSRSDESDSDNEDLQSRSTYGNTSDDQLSDEEQSDDAYSDHDVFEAFQNELARDDAEDGGGGGVDDDDDDDKRIAVLERGKGLDQEPQKDSSRDIYNLRPWNTKERVKACLTKLQKGPDGRYINVLEVATEIDILIASYIKLRKKDDPNCSENSDDDEKYLEGIDIRKFKKLQKRVREGTYEFQPIVQVPLPKRKIVKLKKKKVKKPHEF
ncbi:hypothetical protein KP509_07G066700 [Ceratopteris richardii]|uniref:Uncharacterized protein n=1 Tax=Ceratopteris richardii TaxID=49495 RepID=A0A8T2UM58_CERRI|nr:hypothetical protein KP509_07G066700 [Ceratopteris richardii]